MPEAEKEELLGVVVTMLRDNVDREVSERSQFAIKKMNNAIDTAMRPTTTGTGCSTRW